MGLFNIFKKKQPAQPQPQPEPEQKKSQARGKWNDPEYLRRAEAALQKQQNKPITDTLREIEKPTHEKQGIHNNETIPKYKWLRSGEWEVQINNKTGKPGVFTKNSKEWFDADEAWQSQSGEYYILTGMDANANEGIAISEGARGIRIRKTEELIEAAVITDAGIGYALSDEGTLFTISEEKASTTKLCGDNRPDAWLLNSEFCAVLYEIDSEYNEVTNEEYFVSVLKVISLSTSKRWSKKIKYTTTGFSSFGDCDNAHIIQIITPDNVIHEFAPDGTETK